MHLTHSPSLETARGGFASEVKFVIDRPLADEIRAWSREHLVHDPHGAGPSSDTYTITSLYLDTPQFDVLQRTGSHARAKYRIRRYESSDSVFLERKMKARGRIRKRRTEVSIGQIGRLADGMPNLTWAGYWYHRRILARKVWPVCQIAYDRTARLALTAEGPIRLTLDDGIRAAPVAGHAFHSGPHLVRLFENQIILELKYLHAMPELFSEMIERFALLAQPVSKYRIACAALGFGVEAACPTS